MEFHSKFRAFLNFTFLGMLALSHINTASAISDDSSEELVLDEREIKNLCNATLRFEADLLIPDYSFMPYFKASLFHRFPDLFMDLHQIVRMYGAFRQSLFRRAAQRRYTNAQYLAETTRFNQDMVKRAKALAMANNLKIRNGASDIFEERLASILERVLKVNGYKLENLAEKDPDYLQRLFSRPRGPLEQNALVGQISMVRGMLFETLFTMRLPHVAYQSIKLESPAAEKVRAQMNPLTEEDLTTDIDAIFRDDDGNYHIAEVKAYYYAPWGTGVRLDEQKDQVRRLVHIAKAFKTPAKLWFISRTGFTREGLNVLKSYGDTVVILGPHGDQSSSKFF
jgi:hypothetical protein